MALSYAAKTWNESGGFGERRIASACANDSDADGDAIQKYEFVQTAGPSNNFSLNVPGSNTYPVFGEYYFVDAAWFNQDFRFNILDTAAGTSQIRLRAYDGTLSIVSCRFSP